MNFSWGDFSFLINKRKGEVMQPYFYIIKHNKTGKMYAGCRFAQGCDPSELLKEDGYKTSSGTIKGIIEQEGIDSFSIIDIIELDDPHEYETNFLKEHKCAESDLWYNKHNNVMPSYGSEEFKNMMFAKYGVYHNGDIPEVRERMSKKCSITRKERGIFKGESNPWYGLFGKDHPASGKRSEETIKRMKENCGKWERNEEHCQAISERQKKESSFVLNNPMNDPEKRKLVSLSKIGKKKYKNIITGEYRMFTPGTEPEGYERVKK